MLKQLYLLLAKVFEGTINMSSSPPEYMIHSISNLELTYQPKAGKEYKRCDIPDKWEEEDKKDGHQLTLHQRLAMNEAIVFRGSIGHVAGGNKSNNISNILNGNRIIPSATNLNLVTANVGFIVSDRKHESSIEADKRVHKRIFTTVPINNPEYAIDCLPSNTAFHSEELLCCRLNLFETSERIVTDLSTRLDNKIGSHIGHKVYAVILDIHSTNSICDDYNRCRKKIGDLQTRSNNDKFLLHLENALEKFGYVRGGNNKTKLYCVTRFSSNCSPFLEEANLDRNIKNIKRFSKSIIFHSTREDVTKYDFYDIKTFSNFQSPNNNFFSVSKQTLFANSGSYNPRGRLVDGQILKSDTRINYDDVNKKLELTI